MGIVGASWFNWQNLLLYKVYNWNLATHIVRRGFDNHVFAN